MDTNSDELDEKILSLKIELANKLSILEEKNKFLNQFTTSDNISDGFVANSNKLFNECKSLEIKAKTNHSRSECFRKQTLNPLRRRLQDFNRKVRNLSAFQTSLQTFRENESQLKAQNESDEKVFNLFRKQMEKLDKQNILLNNRLIEMKANSEKLEVKTKRVDTNSAIVGQKRV